jgi:hypothetical protein
MLGLKRKTMASVLGNGGYVMADRSPALAHEHTAACPDDHGPHVVLYAFDGVVGHECSARSGSRVGMPALFMGSGAHMLCPFCGQSV